MFLFKEMLLLSAVTVPGMFLPFCAEVNTYELCGKTRTGQDSLLSDNEVLNNWLKRIVNLDSYV